MSRLSIMIGFSALFGACVAEVEMPIDGDRDGLLDIEEAEAGTDPNVADSDGDGHADGKEIEKGTDPLDIDDHPYMGEYEIDKGCRDDVVSEGNEVGSVTDNIVGVDQFGETVDSYDFCGKYILLINALDT